MESIYIPNTTDLSQKEEIKKHAMKEYEKINKLLNINNTNTTYKKPIETDAEIDDFIQDFKTLLTNYKLKYIKKDGRGKRFGNSIPYSSAIFALDSLSKVLGKPQTIIGGAIKSRSKKNKRSMRKTKRKTHSRKHV